MVLSLECCFGRQWGFSPQRVFLMYYTSLICFVKYLNLDLRKAPKYRAFLTYQAFLCLDWDGLQTERLHDLVERFPLQGLSL